MGKINNLISKNDLNESNNKIIISNNNTYSSIEIPNHDVNKSNNSNNNNNSNNPFLNLENNLKQASNNISFPSPSLVSSNRNNITCENISKNINNPYAFNNNINNNNIAESTFSNFRHNSLPSAETYIESDNNNNTHTVKSNSTNDIDYTISNTNLFNNIDINYDKKKSILSNLDFNNSKNSLEKQDFPTEKLVSLPYTNNYNISISDNIPELNQSDEIIVKSLLVNKSLKNCIASKPILFSDNTNNKVLSKNLSNDTSVIIENSGNNAISKNCYNDKDDDNKSNINKKNLSNNDFDTSPSKHFFKRVSLMNTLDLNVEKNKNNNMDNCSTTNNNINSNKESLINLINCENEKNDINILSVVVNDYSFVNCSTNPFEYNNDQNRNNSGNDYNNKENYNENYYNNNNNNNNNNINTNNNSNNNSNNNNNNNNRNNNNKDKNKNSKGKKKIKHSEKIYEKIEDNDIEYIKNLDSFNDKSNNSSIQSSKVSPINNDNNYSSSVSPINNNVVYPSERKSSLASDLIRYTNPFKSLNNSPYLGGGSFTGDKFTVIKNNQNTFNPQGGFLSYKKNNFGTNNNYIDENKNNLNPINTNINNLSSLTSKNFEIINQLTVMSTESMSSSDMVYSDSPFYESDNSNLQTTKLLNSNSKENLKDVLESNDNEGNKRNTSNYDCLKVEALLSSPSTNTTENETPISHTSSSTTDFGNVQEEDNNNSQADLNVNNSNINLNELDKRKSKTKSKRYSYSSRKSGIDLNINSSIYRDSNNNSILHRTYKGIKKIIRYCFCCQCCLPSNNNNYYRSSIIKANNNSLKIDKNNGYQDPKELIECEMLEESGPYGNKHLINSYNRLSEANAYISVSPSKKYLKKQKRTDSGNGFTFKKRKNHRFKFFRRHNKKATTNQQQSMTLSKLNNTLIYENNTTLAIPSTINSSSLDNNNNNNSNNINNNNNIIK